MCGICGIVAREPIDKMDLRAMAGSLVSRGPDDEGYYLGQNAGLGHRRLFTVQGPARLHSRAGLFHDPWRMGRSALV